VNSKNNKDMFFFLKNHDIVKVNKIIKYTSGQIKIEVVKYNHCTVPESCTFRYYKNILY